MKPVLIIAEAGVNHNGSIEIAKQLIDVAVDCGVDIVKFQTFKTENLVSKSAKKAEYQIENMNDEDNSQFAMLKKLELNESNHLLLQKYCNEKGIEFWSTAFDNESLQLLKKIGVKRWKIPSGEITNLPFLQKIGSYKEEIILSSGMSSLEEIAEAIEVLIKAGANKEMITVLHCNTEYPTPMSDVNLNAMMEIQKQLNVPIGYSDHTLGIEVSIAAVAMGATIIEKHFTLNKSLPGPDHKASLEPNELKEMVAAIRNVEVAMGTKEKQPSEAEKKNMLVVRKSIHLGKDVKEGHILSENDLIMKRPGDGISPMKINEVIGKKIKSNSASDHKLILSDLE